MKNYYLELMTEHYTTQCTILAAGCFIAPDRVWMFAGFFVMTSLRYMYRHNRESNRMLATIEKGGGEP